MKQDEIKIGAVYYSIVSGQEVKVRVVSEDNRAATLYYATSKRKRYHCDNLATGKQVVRTAAALRRRAIGVDDVLGLVAELGIGPVRPVMRDLYDERPSEDGQETYLGRAVDVIAPIVALPAMHELVAMLRYAKAGDAAKKGHHGVRIGTGREGMPNAGMICVSCVVTS